MDACDLFTYIIEDRITDMGQWYDCSSENDISLNDMRKLCVSAAFAQGGWMNEGKRDDILGEHLKQLYWRVGRGEGITFTAMMSEAFFINNIVQRRM